MNIMTFRNIEIDNYLHSDAEEKYVSCAQCWKFRKHNILNSIILILYFVIFHSFPNNL